MPKPIPSEIYEFTMFGFCDFPAPITFIESAIQSIDGNIQIHRFGLRLFIQANKPDFDKLVENLTEDCTSRILHEQFILTPWLKEAFALTHRHPSAHHQLVAAKAANLSVEQFLLNLAKSFCQDWRNNLDAQRKAQIDK